MVEAHAENMNEYHELLRHSLVEKLDLKAMPGWVPAFFREYYRQALACIVRSDAYVLNPLGRKPENIARWLLKLTRYDGGDMHKVWDRILSATLCVRDGRMQGLQSMNLDDDQLRTMFLWDLIAIIDRTYKQPARTKLARDTQLRRAASLCDKLAKLIESDSDVAMSLAFLTTDYLDDCYSAARTAVGEDNAGFSYHSTRGPSSETTTGGSTLDDLARWGIEQNKRANLDDLLRLASAKISIATEWPIDDGYGGKLKNSYRSYITCAVSDLVKFYYGQPFDDAVALIVSAILDLKTPLKRDGVRPYTGRNPKQIT
jgi:hypothetical protein